MQQTKSKHTVQKAWISHQSHHTLLFLPPKYWEFPLSSVAINTRKTTCLAVQAFPLAQRDHQLCFVGWALVLGVCCCFFTSYKTVLQYTVHTPVWGRKNDHTLTVLPWKRYRSYDYGKSIQHYLYNEWNKRQNVWLPNLVLLSQHTISRQKKSTIKQEV